MNIHTSKTGRVAYTPGFLGRNPPADCKKLLKLVLIGAGLIWFGLCLHGYYCEITIGRG